MSETTGDRIRFLRQKNNLLQQELADKVGVSRQVLSNWERDVTPPDAEGLARLSKVLGMSADFILSGFTGPTLPKEIHQIAKALEDDEELLVFFNELVKRDELQILFKQVKPLKKETIKRIIKYIKIVEDEEDQE